MIAKRGEEIIIGPSVRHTTTSLAVLDNGRIILVSNDLSEHNGIDDPADVFGQFLGQDGSVIGGRFQVNTTIAGEQGFAEVTAVSGGFVVVWEDRSVPADRQIRVQKFNLDGQKVGGEFVANTVTAGQQITPVITALEGGGYVVVWHDKIYERDISNRDHLKAQVFTDAGAKVGGEVFVNPWGGGIGTSFGQATPAVTALADGGFAVTWTEQGTGPDTYDTGIRARLFNANGSERGATVVINAPGAGYQSEPAVAQLADGSMMVVFFELISFAEPVRLKAQRFGLDGAKMGGEVVLDHDTATPGTPEILALSNGNFVMLWEGGTAVGLFVREFTASGAPVGETIQVNTHTRGTFLNSSLAETDDGFVVVWATSGGSAPGDTLRSQYFTSGAGPVGPTEGNDVLNGTPNPDTIDGLGGNDQINGLAGDDTLSGGAGNDVLDGGVGVDRMEGGAGNDTYFVDNAGDVVIEAAGGGVDRVNTTVTWSAAGQDIENIAITGTGRINIVGNDLNNVMVGNDDVNALNGGRGADRMVGGGGNDLYYVDNVGDVVVEAAGGGTDTVRSAVTYTLGANVERLQLVGSQQVNAIGNALDNVLQGNARSNVIIGMGGRDLMTGGGGADRFDFRAVSDSPFAAYDRITDLEDQDVINLSAIDANTTLAGDQAFTLVSAFTRQAGQLTLTWNATGQFTVLAADVNGDGLGDFRVILDGDHTDYDNFRL